MKLKALSVFRSLCLSLCRSLSLDDFPHPVALSAAATSIVLIPVCASSGCQTFLAHPTPKREAELELQLLGLLGLGADGEANHEWRLMILAAAGAAFSTGSQRGAHGPCVLGEAMAMAT